jgi:hypothetical protein
VLFEALLRLEIQFGLIVVQLGDFFDAQLELCADFDVVLLALLLQRNYSAVLVLEVLFFLFKVAEGVYLVDVDIQTGWRLVQGIRRGCQFLQQRFRLVLDCLSHVGPDRLNYLSRHISKRLFERRGFQKDSSDLGVCVWDPLDNRIELAKFDPSQFVELDFV